MKTIFNHILFKPSIEQTLEKFQALVATSQQHLEQVWQDKQTDIETALTWLMHYQQRFIYLIGPIQHWQAVQHQQDWRGLHDQLECQWNAWNQWVNQNVDLWQKLHEGSLTNKEPEWQAVLAQQLLHMRLSGIALSDKEKAVFRAREDLLQRLERQYAETLLDATDAFNWWFQDKKLLAGLSPATHQSLEVDPNHWQLRLLEPVVYDILDHSLDPGLRQITHFAYATRASVASMNGCRFDNAPTCSQILAYRDQQAKLLGYPHYAALACADRMAKPTTVVPFLHNLLERLQPAAQVEWQNLCQQQGLDSNRVNPADVSYYQAMFKEKQLGFSPAAIRPYFKLDQVIAGLFWVIEKLFSLKVQIGPSVHADLPVQCWTVCQLDESPIGSVIVDLFARGPKQGGAWLNDWLATAFQQAEAHLPVALLNTNFNESNPVYLTLAEVETLFHEMGHALHHLCTTINLPAIAGITGVAWDAVEVPSQLLEAFSFDSSWLERFAHHDGHAMPDGWQIALQSKHQHLASLRLLRQTMMSLFDWRIHSEANGQWTGAGLQALWAEINTTWGVTPFASYQHLAEQFSHLFDGGYAAGYYSYLWAEVIALDAYDYIKQDWTRGLAFKNHVLAKGSSQPFTELYRQFRGYDASLQALFCYYGLDKV